MNPIPEKRQRPGRAAFIIAEYNVGGRTYRDVIRNIGADGLFIGTWRNFVAEQPIMLKFPLLTFNNIIQTYGTIIRNDSNGFAVKFDEPIKGLICEDGHLPEIVHEGDRPASE